MRSSVGLSLGTCGIRTARTTEDGAWTDGPRFDDWQLSPTAQDVARVVRGIVDTPDAPESLGVACRSPEERTEISDALAEEYVSDVHLIDETGAALAYLRPGLPSHLKTIAVFDAGDSGVDVNIVDVESGRSYGSTRTTAMSGAAFDVVVREHILGLGIVRAPQSRDEDSALTAFCRGIKEALSSHLTTSTPDGEHILLERHIFELSIARSTEEAAETVRRLGLEAEFYPDAVVAIGGTSNIPLVRSTLERFLQLPVIVPDKPELVVAGGAAVHATHIDATRVPPLVSHRPALARLGMIALPIAGVIAAIGLFTALGSSDANQPSSTPANVGEAAPSTMTPATTSTTTATVSPLPDIPPPPPTTTAPAPAVADSVPYVQYQQPHYYPPPPPPPPPTVPLPQIPGVQMPVIPLPVLPRLPF
ncbi:Hsp70 family protein [Rhodococcus sp. ARC_M5]|uniref:Hsp70 family protein n=1 Tax=Rhodococcus sp. ARC_M5 TaxID=2928851 RepID=UPI001FB36AA6|nr:Hsp70 family protein [Rhodococcus sp. ARC_M5]MCJ0891119.1 Hsp70 family protein [Rhodococcus sp. ARC_M5]